jgi:DNA-binding response OmpR family regulator
MRLLLVEDNEQLSQLLRRAFNSAGYDVDVVTTAGDARSALTTTYYGMLVLDLGLPDENGLSLLRELRKKNILLPVLILTARDGIGDRVAGLRTGAEDYLVKPFAMDELIARVQVLLRRSDPEQCFRLGNLELIIDQHGSQVFIDGRSQTLGAREISILEILLRRRERVVSRRLMIAHISGGDTASVTLNAIEVYVHRLRKSLAECGAKVLIHTVKGVGYMMSESRHDQGAR